MKTVLRWMYIVARYLAAYLIITYGFAKLNGAQFTSLDSDLDKPMRDASGIVLTWYYFGYSHYYGTLIGVVQILGGVLLMFRRTTLVGTFLLLPVIGNIILVDIFYDIHYSALINAAIILCALLFILANHSRELLALFWSKQSSMFPQFKRHTLEVVAKGIVCVLVIVMPYGMTYWAANFNNRHPTPIDGTWSVVGKSVELESSEIPTVLYFEPNGNRMVVFRYGPEKFERHFFEVDPQLKTIGIWDAWFRKGEKLFEGKYELSNNQLKLHGKLVHRETESTLVLAKKR
jgi:hypothetical protein